MKQFCQQIFLLFCLCIPAFAQESQVGATGTVLFNSGAGYSDISYGGAAHVAQQVLNGRVVIVGQIGAETSKKVLIDSGVTVRGRVEARWYESAIFNHNLKPFLSGGVNYSRLITKDYSKQAFQPLIGGGVNWDDTVIARYAYLLPEHQTLNRTRGHRAGVDVYLPFAPESKWNYLIGAEYEQWRFYQPWGPQMGWNTGRTLGMSVGVSRVR